MTLLTAPMKPSLKEYPWFIFKNGLRMNTTLRLALFMTTLVSPVSFAGFENGEALLSKCLSENGYSFGVCRGYLEGIHEAQEALIHWGKADPVFCPPRGVTPGQLKTIVIEHMKQHPEDLHFSAGSIVINALSVAFPPSNREGTSFCQE